MWFFFWCSCCAARRGSFVNRTSGVAVTVQDANFKEFDRSKLNRFGRGDPEPYILPPSHILQFSAPASAGITDAKVHASYLLCWRIHTSLTRCVVCSR